MITDADWIRLARFVSGECSPEAREATRRWIATSPERERLTETLREISAATSLDPSEWDTQAAWERLLLRAEQAREAPVALSGAPRGAMAGAEAAAPRSAMVGMAHDGTAHDGTAHGAPRGALSGSTHDLPRRAALSIAQRPVQRRLRLGALAMAASAMLAVVGGLWVDRNGWSTPFAAPVQAAAPREFSTARAQLAEVRLTDGSTVVLAAESRLTVPVDYGSGQREVTLDGEAYFDVVHDDGRPFVVRTGPGVVHDLGTKFAVRHHEGDAGVQVVVTEGRVMLRADDSRPATGPVLERGDLGLLDSTGTIAVTRDVDVDRYIGWTQGRLTFYDAPLPEVLAQLDRWYDVQFTLDDPALRARRITMSVPTTSVDGLVEALGLTLDLHAEHRGNTIVLRRKSH